MAAAPTKASTGYTSLKDMFDGGGPGKPGSTFSGGAFSNAANSMGIKPMGSSSSSSSSSMSSRPVAKPAIAVSGTGQNRQYIDTSTGQRYSEPSYSPFSLKGFTSTDPANVARNRAAAAMYAKMAANRGESSSGQGIMSLTGSGSGGGGGGGTSGEQGSTTPPLASIGAPTTPIASPEVPTPVYGVPGASPQMGQSYGQAFAGLPPGYSLPQYLNLMDIFGTFPNFGQMA